jgi:hypothetical protein
LQAISAKTIGIGHPDIILFRFRKCKPVALA